MKTEQLNLVFAEWHKAKVKEFEAFMTGAISGLGAAACAVSFRDNIQRAECVIRQSGSERGAVVQTTAPTRRDTLGYPPP